MSSATRTIPALATLILVFGCGKSAELDVPQIVSEGNPPKQVLLTKTPPLGSKQTMHTQVEMRDVADGKKVLFSSTEVGEVSDVHAGLITEAIHNDEVKFLQNDYGIDEGKLTTALQGLHYKIQSNKNGDHVSGGSGKVEPTSYHYPDHLVGPGDEWKGWKGTGKAKQEITFTVDRLMKSKGDDLAVISYQYEGSRGNTVTAREWVDTSTGWTVRVEESSDFLHKGKPAKMITRSIDTNFE